MATKRTNVHSIKDEKTMNTEVISMILIIVGIAALVFGMAYMIMLGVALGTALVDPNAYCLYNNTHPYRQFCEQQIQEKEFILDLIKKMCEEPTSQCSFDEGQ